jgi:hypothetical protein
MTDETMLDGRQKTTPGKNKLQMDHESLIYFINYILKQLKSDRRLALDNFKAIDGVVDLALMVESGSEAMIMSDIVESQMKFLNSSAGSIDKMIKMAKIMSDTLNKATVEDEEFELSDFERGIILDAANEFTTEAKKAKKKEVNSGT